MYYIYDVNGTEYTKVPIEFNHVSSSKRKQEPHGGNPDTPANYLTFTYKAGSPKGSQTKGGNHRFISFEGDYTSLEYSLDSGSTWTALEEGYLSLNDIELNDGDKIMFRGEKCANVMISLDLNSEGQFQLSGDINSMYNGKGGPIELHVIPLSFYWDSSVFNIDAHCPVFCSGSYVSPFDKLSEPAIDMNHFFLGLPVKGKNETFDDRYFVLNQHYPFVVKQQEDGDTPSTKSDPALWQITINNDCEFGFWAGLDKNEDSGFTFSNVKTIHVVYDESDSHSVYPDAIFNSLKIFESDTSTDYYTVGARQLKLSDFIEFWNSETGELYDDGNEGVFTIPATSDFLLGISSDDKIFTKEHEEDAWTEVGDKFTPVDGMYVKMTGGK